MKILYIVNGDRTSFIWIGILSSQMDHDAPWEELIIHGYWETERYLWCKSYSSRRCNKLQDEISRQVSGYDANICQY